MNRKQKILYAVAGFFIGNVILGSLIFGVYYTQDYQSSKNKISFDEALQRIKSKEIKEIKIKSDKAVLIVDEKTNYSTDVSESQIRELFENANYPGLKTNFEPVNKIDSMERVFQILFILFIISPPIIVILLLVIIGKMKSKENLD